MSELLACSSHRYNIVKRTSGDRYCYLCGQELAPVSPSVACDCGRLIQLTDRFCPRCGKSRVEDKKTPPAAPVTKPKKSRKRKRRD